jgi:hypothetical protein
MSENRFNLGPSRPPLRAHSDSHALARSSRPYDPAHRSDKIYSEFLLRIHDVLVGNDPLHVGNAAASALRAR